MYGKFVNRKKKKKKNDTKKISRELSVNWQSCKLSMFLLNSVWKEMPLFINGICKLKH